VEFGFRKQGSRRPKEQLDAIKENDDDTDDNSDDDDDTSGRHLSNRLHDARFTTNLNQTLYTYSSTVFREMFSICSNRNH